ncbi:DUF6438 domain-containing protein [Flavobacterium terrigena]|uniref:DUF6438 domain-containing protein n=1 Tax=Flavobacterium terrigena TaxID=402734 RepID=A0A1H6VKW2_9FLAO|nr:DUF6438 domain-containing protein [Flavobacterium terrigena]SEJ02327.1 hypothetical protein SAMN05660918_2186 [Flavobacterium terrigena]
MKKYLYLIITSHLIISCATKKNEDRFEKIIFHTTKCFGTCPEYHLELNKNQEIKLYIEKAYQKRILDTSRIGYYKGKLDNKTYAEFLELLGKMDLDKSGIIEPEREPNTVVLRETSQLYLILYNDKLRKPIIYIYPAGHWQKIMAFLYKIAEDKSLTKTNEELDIEKFD